MLDYYSKIGISKHLTFILGYANIALTSSIYNHIKTNEMETFIFKKDGEDNQKIIEAILEFVKKDPKCLFKESTEEGLYPVMHSVSDKNDISYLLANIFDGTTQKTTTFLQVTSKGQEFKASNKHAITVIENSEINFQENKITIKNPSGYETILDIRN